MNILSVGNVFFSEYEPERQNLFDLCLISNIFGQKTPKAFYHSFDKKENELKVREWDRLCVCVCVCVLQRKCVIKKFAAKLMKRQN